LVDRGIDSDVVKCLVIAGPGFAKDLFHDYLFEECVKRNNKRLKQFRDHVVLIGASTAYKHGLKVAIEKLWEN